MLTDLRSTLSRLETIEASTSLITTLLSRHCEDFSEWLERVRDCGIPCVKRVLAEELMESVDSIVFLPTANNRWRRLEHTTLWRSYRDAAKNGQVLDLYLVQYLKARRFVHRWLEHGYESEVIGADYKTKRYAYALSGKTLPAWFEEDLLIPRLEQIVTAYGNMLVTILGYAEECTLAVA